MDLEQAIKDNDNFKDKELLTNLGKLFADRPNALEFIYEYGLYIELIDDLVDEDKNINTIRKTTELAAKVFNCNYWKQYGPNLILLERVIARQYFDSVQWERSNSEWKKRDARCLNHCGYNMLFAVIIIEFGEDKLDELSLKFREHAHLKHINDPL